MPRPSRREHTFHFYYCRNDGDDTRGNSVLIKEIGVEHFPNLADDDTALIMAPPPMRADESLICFIETWRRATGHASVALIWRRWH